MKQITKTLLVLVSALSISFAATAGELSMTGAAKASYVIGGSDDSQSKGLGVSNEFTANASGEMDNGWTWTYMAAFDPSDGGATSNDDSSLVLGMGDMGTVAIYDTTGGLSKELGYGIGALGTGYDWGGTMTVQAGLDVSSYPNVQYHLPADLLPFGMTAKVGYAPNLAEGQGNSFQTSGPINPQTLTGTNMTGYAVTMAPVDGLSIGADYHTTDGQLGTTVQEAESGNYYAQYAMGNFKIGYNKGHYVPGLASRNGSVSEYENTSMGIEFAVNDALSISWNDEDFEATTSVAIVAAASTGVKTYVESNQETLQLAYVMGGATIGVATMDVTNADYTASKEEKKTIFTIAMDF